MGKVSPDEWKGKNRFFCKKRCMTGSNHDDFTLVIAHICIVSMFVAYTLFETTFYLENYNFIPPLIGYILAACCIFFMIKTTVMDPGAIPRGDLESAEQAAQLNALNDSFEEKQPLSTSENKGTELLLKNSDLSDMNAGETTNRTNDQQDIETTDKKEVDEDKKRKEQEDKISIYRSRYCKTCKIMRPPKSSHCGYCDNCVQEFDHHCFFVGNCIGRRNHREFVLFLFFGGLFSIYCFPLSGIAIYDSFQNYPVGAHLLDYPLLLKIGGGLFVAMFLWACAPRVMTLTRYVIGAIGIGLCLLSVFLSTRHLGIPYNEDPAFHAGYLLACSVFALWLMPMFMGQMYNISLHFTVKQRVVVEREGSSQQIQRLYNLTFEEKKQNIKDFLFRKNIESQVEGVL